MVLCLKKAARGEKKAIEEWDKRDRAATDGEEKKSRKKKDSVTKKRHKVEPARGRNEVNNCPERNKLELGGLFREQKGAYGKKEKTGNPKKGAKSPKG